MTIVTQLLSSLPKSLDDNAGGLIWVEVADQGLNDGIDIRVYHPFTGDLCFEIVTLSPDICPLVGNTPQSNVVFRAFCRALSCTQNMCQISILIQFHDCHSAACMEVDESEDRNSRIHRMVENIADEIVTHRLGSKVELAMQQFGRMITSLM